ncbi:hypothetical protein Rleg4DRAFT_6078 [Rhizobium leguminosarum bv. trifolii WSM2297]|uniref:DUF2066 domain-containing protein n=1 Tax=Rhizobium leguminosarum bv. trifolii WSM2297 TaxID=754762 RepID=J0WFT7_RHILT|nr:DUF2066 domain-containing protein [Rhizobium leguminosarum]EJC84268.1 hypothetical protein Rleg4DRAFT_6078 [Rhizobium leguminosarum bv. trifolii WSM2297]
MVVFSLIHRDQMIRSRKAFICLMLVLASGVPAGAGSLDELYTSQTIVTGTGEKNRETGFRDCLERVLLRVSGDQRLVERPEMSDLKARGSTFVREYTYRDRLAGKPFHDAQGMDDRPHDLTCYYDQPVVDGLLDGLGSRPWRDKRPVTAVFLEVKRYQQEFRVNASNARDAAMREAFAQAATSMAMTIIFPAPKDSDRAEETPDVTRAAVEMGADVALTGSLVWSDSDFGWVATWHLAQGQESRHWQVRGVNFDEAFRVGVRGVAQILSGNGQP